MSAILIIRLAAVLLCFIFTAVMGAMFMRPNPSDVYPYKSYVYFDPTFHLIAQMGWAVLMAYLHILWAQSIIKQRKT